MELSTPIGLVLGFGALLGAFMMEGGSPIMLLSPSAAIIVLGGTIAAILIAFPLKSVLVLPKLLMQTFFSPSGDPQEIVNAFVGLADKARREGLLALEEDSKNIEDPFMRKGVMLVVDGVDPEVVRDIMETDADLVAERHSTGQGMLAAMGGFAPTMGIIGTVMGLVNVLSNLADPEHLGESIAVAFIATLYGVVTANILWLPMGNKLKKKSETELHVRYLMVEGVLAVQAGENPRIVREKLDAFLPPAERGSGEEA
ncbi:MAG: flagellar motor protein [Chloroflexi bacterium]|nr:flagellar motor protein [Chloroflexota bacterium]